MIREAFALVGRITERVFPDRPMLGDRVVYEAQELPMSIKTSPAGASDPPTPAPAGLPTCAVANLQFPDPAEMPIWPDWLLMRHAANLITFTPETRQTVDELRIRAFALQHGVAP